MYTRNPLPLMQSSLTMHSVSFALVKLKTALALFHGHMSFVHAIPDDTPRARAHVADPEPPAEVCAVRDIELDVRNQPFRRQGLRGAPELRFAQLVDLGHKV